MNFYKPKTAKVLGFFLFLIFFTNLSASEIINLKFLDLWDYSPLSGVEVLFNNQSLKSDTNGELKIPSDKSESLELIINLDGYYSQQVKIIQMMQHKTIYLQPLEKSSKIQITANRPDKLNIDMAGPSAIIRTPSVNIGDAESVSALLDNSTGVFIKNYGTGSALKTISMRGFGAEQTVFNYDGININNKQLGSTELSLLNLQNVSKIELYRGGNSSLFGSGAVAGVVNFVPSLPVDKFQYVISNSYGSWNNLHNAIMTNFSFGGLNHRININRKSGDNNFPFSFKDKNYNRKNSDQKYFQIGYNLYHKSSEILAEIIFSKNNRGVSKQVLDQVKENNFARQKDNSIFSRLKWIPFQQSELQIYWFQQSNIYDDPGLLINNQKTHSEHTNDVFGLQFSKGLALFDFIRSFTKLEIEKNYINSTNAGKHDRLRSALSSILEGSIYKFYDIDLRLSGSLRWENYSETGNTLLPKIGFTVSGNQFNIYSTFGYNFRNPTFNELYWQPGGNPDLQSEESKSLEIGCSIKGDFIGPFTFNFDYYRNEIRDMIRWVPDNQSSMWRPQNISSVKGEGVEIGVNYGIFTDLLFLNGNYSFSSTIKTKAEFEGDYSVNNQVPFIPREMVNLGLTMNWNSWKSNLTWSHTGFRYLSFSNSGDDFLPSHNLISLQLGYEFGLIDQYCTISLQLYNILDKKYQVMYGYPMPGRNFKLSLIIHN
jgi:outer membrane cobalamin receptor